MFGSFGSIGTGFGGGGASAGGTASVPTTLVYRYTTSTDAPNTTLPTNATVQLPFESNINGHVDWGDGSPSENFFAEYDESRPSHTYATEGDYTITISPWRGSLNSIPNGTYDRIVLPKFRGGRVGQSIREGFISIKIGDGFGRGKAGEIITNSFKYAFRNMKRLKEVEFLATPRVQQVTAERMFLGAGVSNDNYGTSNPNIKARLERFNLSNVYEYNQMFQGCGVVDVDIDKWNFNGLGTSSGMAGMFANYSPSPYSETKISNSDVYGNLLRSLRSYASNNSNIRNITMNMGGSQFTDTLANRQARQFLITLYGFTITDGWVA